MRYRSRLRVSLSINTRSLIRLNTKFQIVIRREQVEDVKGLDSKPQAYEQRAQEEHEVEAKIKLISQDKTLHRQNKKRKSCSVARST